MVIPPGLGFESRIHHRAKDGKGGTESRVVKAAVTLKAEVGGCCGKNGGKSCQRLHRLGAGSLWS